MLFINAEPELTRSRGINRLGPEGIEKIVDVFRDRADVPGFSRVVSTAEIEANEFNLSVRPYTDQGLPPEAPADAVAIISGDVPIREVQAAEQRFRAFGIDPATLFLSANSGYLSFPPQGYLATARTLSGQTATREEEFGNACRSWWNGSALNSPGSPAKGDCSVRGLGSARHYISALVIRSMEGLGLAWDVVRVTPERRAAKTFAA